MAKIVVILENSPGVVMERQEIEVIDDPEIGGPDSDDVNDRASAMIEGWMLSVGDTIKIRLPGEEE